MGAKILLTGAAGFLGSNLLNFLQEKGYDVIVFEIARPNIDCKFIEGDLRDLDALTKAAKNADYIFHLGGIGDVYLALEKPYLAAACNVQGTANIMESALKNDVKRVVYASTWEVYGNPQYNPIDEKHACNPDHPYNITKYAGEQIAMAYSHFKNAPFVSLRLGTAYGKGMRPNSVFSLFINNALNKKGITIQGTGKQFRQFTHATDIAQAFVRAMESNVSGECFNIVSEEKVSIRQLAEAVAQLIPTKITFTEARKGDIPSAEVSSKKAQQILNWSPGIKFEQGIKELVGYHRQRTGQ